MQFIKCRSARHIKVHQKYSKIWEMDFDERCYQEERFEKSLEFVKFDLLNGSRVLGTELCLPKFRLKSYPLVPQNMTVFRSRVFKR